MTPLEFAGNLARSDKYEDRVLGVAIVTRGLTDAGPMGNLREGWPLDGPTVEAASKYLGILPNPKFVADVLAQAPKVSDAMLNKGAADARR